jgi:arylsulfatase A-like enzyme
VIFTNDNGGEWLSRNAPLFHRKGTLWEGGIRVPAIMKWPGRVPAGRTTGQVGITMDLTTTILAATATPVPPDARFEGIDLIPLIQDHTRAQERTLFWRVNVATRQQRATRHGPWKLLMDGGIVFLFDLSKDIGERQDLALTRPDLVRQLREKFLNWQADVDADLKLQGKSTPQ